MFWLLHFQSSPLLMWCVCSCSPQRRHRRSARPLPNPNWRVKRLLEDPSLSLPLRGYALQLQHLGCDSQKETKPSRSKKSRIRGGAGRAGVKGRPPLSPEAKYSQIGLCRTAVGALAAVAEIAMVHAPAQHGRRGRQKEGLGMLEK